MNELQEALEELKHATKVHILIAGSPTPQLAFFLTKTIDIMEDGNKPEEIIRLALAIVESTALAIYKQFGNDALPPQVKQKLDKILIVVNKCKNAPDKVAAKEAVLRTAAEALIAMNAATQKHYPRLYDRSGLPYAV